MNKLKSEQEERIVEPGSKKDLEIGAISDLVPVKSKPDAGKKDSPEPSDLKFRNSNKNITTYVLRLKGGEELKDGLARLIKAGWNVDSQPYTREGNAIRAVGKRIKTSVRDLKKGDLCTVEYYDIQEAANEEALDPGKIWEKTMTFQSSKGQMIVFTTEGGTSFGFPISVIANIQKLDQKSESKESDPGETKDSKPKEGSDPLPPNDSGPGSE